MIIITGSLPCDYFITSVVPPYPLFSDLLLYWLGRLHNSSCCNSYNSFLRISTISAIIKKTMITFPTHCYNTKAPDWNYMVKIAEDK